MTDVSTLRKRIAAGALLLLFSMSAVGGSICTGHSAPHDAGAGSWIAGAAMAAEPAHRTVPVDDVAQDKHDGHGAADSGAECDSPVYLKGGALGRSDDIPDHGAELDPYWLVDHRLATLPDVVLLRRGVFWPCSQPPPPEDRFCVTARLRL